MIFWHAASLVNMERLEDSLPLFRRATLLPRLRPSGILPGDAALLDRILAESR